MTDSSPQSRRIRILRDEVSRKIAAGEVIDRPFSIVRELIDNALDAGARAVDVHLDAGGIERVRVVDDGAGMGFDDLVLCWQPHATSKIETEDDLLRVSSLGFRGEALSSIAVCSRLVVVSCEGGDGPAHRLEVHGGRQVGIEASQGRRGTVVDVSELFYNYPARKKFLRSVSAESGLCRALFIDRAAAHPGVSFRLFTDGEMKISLPAGRLLDRIALAYGHMIPPQALVETQEPGEGFVVTVVGAAEVRRRDRKLLQCFVNRRRVSEYSLLQAAEYGFAGILPGGWHPVAFVFVEIDPSLADFNVHPAKKEVRFRNLPAVHAAVARAARTIAQPLRPVPGHPAAAGGLLPGIDYPPTPAHGAPPHGARGQVFSLPPRQEAPTVPAPQAGQARFLGQIFGVFLVFELPGRLLVLDQHAAHERIIFERLGARALAMQELLFPLSFDVSEEEERRVMDARTELEAMGIAVRRAGARAFEVSAVSADFHALPEDTLVELVRGVGGAEWQRGLRATAACRMAIKDGDRVDAVTAQELCAQALELAVPRCPHGRPLWHELSEEGLLRSVDRPVPAETRSPLRPGPR